MGTIESMICTHTVNLLLNTHSLFLLDQHAHLVVKVVAVAVAIVCIYAISLRRHGGSLVGW